MPARTHDKRLWLAGAATVAVVTVLIGWFGVIQPELSSASANREQAASASAQNTLLAAKNRSLKQQDATALRADLAAALAELPSGDGLPAFTRQLSAQATATSVVLSSVIVGAATLVDQGSATATDSATSTGATSESDASAGALVQMTITVAAAGPGPDLQAFLKKVLVEGPRRALVTESQLTPSGGGSGGINGPCTLTLTLNIFSAPLSPVDQAALEKLLSDK